MAQYKTIRWLSKVGRHKEYSKSIYKEALFGYRYDVARPHFKGDQVLDVYSILSNCYKLYGVSFQPCSLEN